MNNEDIEIKINEKTKSIQNIKDINELIQIIHHSIDKIETIKESFESQIDLNTISSNDLSTKTILNQYNTTISNNNNTNNTINDKNKSLSSIKENINDIHINDIPIDITDNNNNNKENNKQNNSIRSSFFRDERLNRMKDIHVDFHNGLPEEFYKALSRSIHDHVEIKRRYAKLKMFRDCFLGCDAIQHLIEYGYADNEKQAELYGSTILKLNYIENISRGPNDILINSNNNYYRFTNVLHYRKQDTNNKDSKHSKNRSSSISSNTNLNLNSNDTYRESLLSMARASPVENYSFNEASDEVHAFITTETLQIIIKCIQKIFEKKNKLLYYKGYNGCFLGAEVVSLLMELKITNTKIDAILIGQALIDDQFIIPIEMNYIFQNKYIFYRLPNIEQQSYKLISNSNEIKSKPI